MSRWKMALEAGILKRLVTVLVMSVVWFAMLFAAAGRTDWWQAWFYAALTMACTIANYVIVALVNPELIRARSRVGANVEPFDKVCGALYALLLFATPVVAGLDAIRFGWSSFSGTMFYFGAALQVIADVPIVWSMAVNRHLETTVRIQSERGHQPVTTGPYAIVRHPMYVGVILQNLAAPLILGSRWSCIPVILISVLFVVRTSLEDRTLRRELEGYEEFTHSTRYRLIPGVW